MSYACAKKQITPFLADAKKEGKTYDSVTHEVHERLYEFAHLKSLDISTEDRKVILALTRSGVIDLLDSLKENYLREDKEICEIDDTEAEIEANEESDPMQKQVENIQEDVHTPETVIDDRRIGGIMEF